MAKIESYFNCDLKKAVQVQVLSGNVFSMDNNGNRICVRIFNDGKKATVTGSVSGRCILADGSTVNVSGGLTTANGQSVAYVDIPQGCLLIPGTLKITVQLTDSGVITTLAAILTTVYQTKTDNVITPSQQIINDWNAAISSALGAQDAQISALSTALTAEATARQNADNDLKSALSQDDQINRDILSLSDNSILSLAFVQGSISSAGHETDSDIRIRTVSKIYVEMFSTLKAVIGSGYKYEICKYNKDGTYSSTGWLSADSPITLTGILAIRVIVAKNDDTSINPSDGSNFSIEYSTRISNAFEKNEYDIENTDKNAFSPCELLINEYGYIDKVFGNYTQGNINSSTGEINPANMTRIVTKDFVEPLGDDIQIILMNGDYSYEIDTYNSDGTYVSNVGWLDENRRIPFANDKKYRIVVRKNDNSNISPSVENEKIIRIIRHKIELDAKSRGYNSKQSLWLESGTIGSSGSLSPATNRVRTYEYFNNDSDYRVELIDFNYSLEFDIFDNNGNFISGNGWLDNGFDCVHSTGYRYKMLVRKNDNSSITPFEAAQAIKVYAYKDESGTADYWDTYLDNKIEEINALKESNGKCINFIHISDMHYEYNEKHSPYLISKIVDRCNVNYIFNTGDNVSPTGTSKGRQQCEAYHKMILNDFKKAGCFDKYFAVFGNHDTNFQNNIPSAYFFNVVIQPSKVYQMMSSSIEQHREIKAYGEGLVYCIDDNVQDVRFIVLNSCDSGEILNTYTNTRETWGLRQGQINFILDCLATSEHDIVILGHIPFLSSEVKNYDIIKRCLEAYNNRSTYSKTNTFEQEIYNASVDVNFANAEHKVLAAFFGHDHVDKIQYYFGIVGVQIDTDSLNTESEFTRTPGTISEQCFDVVCIDREAGKIYCTRIGAGNNRTINIEES
jgi:hypothetical protein